MDYSKLVEGICSN